MSNQIIEIYTDGACSGNPGPGGYGIVLKHQAKSKELFAGFQLTTNNRMELLAVIVALESLRLESCSFDLRVYSDSKYVIDSIRLGWLKKWQKNNWKKSNKQSTLNKDLWQRLLRLIEQIEREKHTISWNWVKAHSGQVENEICDKLAVRASKSSALLKDCGFSP